MASGRCALSGRPGKRRRSDVLWLLLRPLLEGPERCSLRFLVLGSGCPNPHRLQTASAPTREDRAEFHSPAPRSLCVQARAPSSLLPSRCPVLLPT
ncbi:hypothetical protein P7K49_001289 [Saguinus oedipus]|uniref:Uncharacterized protein n=1 Tax=Saguinus oedipus TaxID=9490 RepID=A0ABQ9WGJ8_SAGOE|nr:hypothetical protein P7K49_001289 [Saguinus oedipus]